MSYQSAFLSTRYAKKQHHVLPTWKMLNLFLQRTTAENLGVSSLDPNTLARELKTQADPITFQRPRAVSVAGWGKTRDRKENRENTFVSDIWLVLRTSFHSNSISFLFPLQNVGASSDALLHADIPINEDCNEKLRAPGGINEQKQICAGKKGYDSCNGDSGGPLTLG